MLQIDVETSPNVVTVDGEYKSEFSFLNIASNDNFLFHQSNSKISIIPDTWILLKSQSTVSVLKNPRFLSNIKTSTSTLRVHTNGGTQFSSQVGTVKNFGEVWFNMKSLANILSMAAVRKVCRITMDTSVEAAMHVHRKDGTIMTFRDFQSGLYYYDAAEGSSNINSETDDAYTFSYTP
jgi:hypothetical protein